jgi:acyl-CoA synthetase (AMP-forming)/AMP-acid ligase II
MIASPVTIATIADKRAIEAEPVERQWRERTVYELLTRTAESHGDRPAVSFQLRGGPRDPATTLSWAAFRERVTQAANLFRDLGVGRGDTVAYLLPNAPETAVALVAGMTAGIVAPINPLLEPEQIAAILRETGAKVLVTLKPFVRTDLSAKAALAVRNAPQVRTVLEVDLGRHLTGALRLVAPFLAPRRVPAAQAKVLSFRRESARRRGDALGFADDAGPDTPCAYFHTGGTTGAPKVAVHTHRGALYNGWLVRRLLVGPEDVLLCPLPLFHVLAAYPMLTACIASGAHFVMPTPAGYRGEGVIDNFWKLVERWRVNFVCTVPTAVAALMQRPIDADLSSLRYAICGSAPMPVELFHKFEKATGVKLLEGYGQTETTCLISCNPAAGERKIGSVGLPMPYTEAMILRADGDGRFSPAPPGEIGEICVRSPGVIAGYLEPERNVALFAAPGVARTGDLGRIDDDGYLWITGRAKDLIIRGGHNIDPAVIEEALLAHPDVTLAGAVGQPDAYAGELPCAYVEVRAGATVDGEALRRFAAEHVSERAARPAHVEIMAELPKTAVGKIFKPDLRKRAIARVYEAALAEARAPASVVVVEDHVHGLVAEVRPRGPADAAAVGRALDAYPGRWRLAE